MWKSVRLDKYPDCKSSLEAYLWIDNMTSDNDLGLNLLLNDVMNLDPQGWTKEQLLYMSNIRELDRVPSTEQSTLYTNPHGSC